MSSGLKMMKYKILEDYLDSLIPNPKCELDYFNDYSLLIAIMLSAQTTDKRVNIVTKEYKGSVRNTSNFAFNDNRLNGDSLLFIRG